MAEPWRLQHMVYGCYSPRTSVIARPKIAKGQSWIYQNADRHHLTTREQQGETQDCRVLSLHCQSVRRTRYWSRARARTPTRRTYCRAKGRKGVGWCTSGTKLVQGQRFTVSSFQESTIFLGQRWSARVFNYILLYWLPHYAQKWYSIYISRFLIHENVCAVLYLTCWTYFWGSKVGFFCLLRIDFHVACVCFLFMDQPVKTHIELIETLFVILIMTMNTENI